MAFLPRYFMKRFPEWIDNLFAEPEVPADRASPSHADEHQIKKFLANNFSYKKIDDGTQLEINDSYTLKTTDVEFSKDQIKKLIGFMKDHHFDGVIYDITYAPSTKNVAIRYTKTFFKALAQNLRPQATAYQILASLEVTATLSAIWEQDPNYYPSPFLFVGLGVAVLAMLRSNHFYTSIIGGLSSDDILTIQEKITRQKETLFCSENLGAFPEEAHNPLFHLLTKPNIPSRIDQEIRAWISYLVKLSASAAVFLEEFKTLPLHLVLSAAFVAGSFEGIDAAFTMVTAIGGEHKALFEYKDGIIPPPSDSNRALIFPYLADFPLIPWAMAKVGPAMWAVVKARAAFTFMRLIDLKSKDVQGGIYGFYSIALLSAAYVSCVFSQYNVDQKLGQHLPTIRDFKYTHKFDVQSVAKAAIGAVPVAAIAAYAARYADFDIFDSAVISLPLWTLTTMLIWHSEKFAEYYSQGVEMRFVNPVINTIDRWHTEDKFAAAIVGACITVLGVYKDWPVIAAPGEALMFVMLPSAVIAECENSGITRSTASAIRYVTVQACLYAAALMTWILNCALPLYNLATHKDPNDRPSRINTEYFHQYGYYLLVFGGLIASVAAGYKDFCSMGSKVKTLVAPIPEEEIPTQS